MARKRNAKRVKRSTKKVAEAIEQPQPTAEAIEQPQIEQPSEHPIPLCGGWTRKIDPVTGQVVADQKVSDDAA